MPSSFLQKLFHRTKPAREVEVLHNTENAVAVHEEKPKARQVPSGPQEFPPAAKPNLFAFVDLTDPFFSGGEIAGEELPGPILSILSARKFGSLFLFHTPHTRENALATVKEVTARYPDCQVTLHELPVSNPKDYSSLMGSLCRQLRDLAVAQNQTLLLEKIPAGIPDATEPTDADRLSQMGFSAMYKQSEAMRLARSESNYVCVSSGTAEMRATWFLVTALGILPAKLLQVGSSAYQGFGDVNVKEVRIDTTDWETIRNLVMPAAYFGRLITSPAVRRRGRAHLSDSASSELKDLLTGSGAPKSPDADQKVSRVVGGAEQAGFAPPRKVGPYEIIEKIGQGGMSEVYLARDSCLGRTPIQGLDEALEELDVYVGSAMLRLCAELAGIAAGSHLPILLLGETGTGKERFAQLIHRLSPRFQNDMMAINCAAIPKELAESYLFGHIKGAFTGATSDKKGVFENAENSTLFLDEIAELTPEIQAKLLRVIQDGAIQRVGSTIARQVDVRIIAATNRDLRSEMAAGRFREDLYFRLEVLQINLPALRDRPSEVPGLALALLKKINQRRQKPHQLSKGALQRLEHYTWPGNVRQLSNVLERSVLYARKDVIEADDLLIAEDVPAKDPLAILPEPIEGFSIEEYLSQARKQLYLRALAKCKGNQAEAAALLGVTRQAVSKFMAGEIDNPS
jgi:transcriptional regulator with AAA-type ATPase domain